MQGKPERPDRPKQDERQPGERYVNLERLRRTKEDFESFMKELNRILDDLEKEKEKE